MEMVTWFFVILAADVVAYALIGLASQVDWKKLFKKKKSRRARKTKLAQIIPLKKAE